LPPHPTARSLNAYPFTDDENLAENEQDGIRREFDDADASGNPLVTVLFEVIVAPEAKGKGFSIFLYDCLFTVFLVREVSLLDCTCSQQAMKNPESQYE
jgi:hypothetical protein